LYSGGGGDDDELDNIREEEDDELPRWAARLQDSNKQFAKPALGTLSFDGCNKEEEEEDVVPVTIKIEERSWEKYHAFILRRNSSSKNNDNDDAVMCPPFRVSPSSGSLAPRGGASNVCDDTKPYLDSATILIEWVGDAGGVGEGGNEWLLVAGTEAEVWRYRLFIA